MLLLLLTAITQAAELRGEVRGADGDPVPGVTVLAYDARLNYGYATTTNTGSFDLTGLPGGRYRLRAVPSSAQNYTQRFWPASWSFCEADVVEVAEDGVVEGLDFVLELGGRVRGVVTDLSGAPLSGVSVTCAGAEGRVGNELHRTTSGEDGAFELIGLDGDLDALSAFTLEFEVDGWPDQFLGQAYDDDDSELIALRLGEELELGANALLDGIGVSGQVSGPEGPLASAAVHVYASSQIISTTSDETGAYVVQGLPPGDVLSWASLDGYGLTYWPDVDRPGERVPAPDEGLLVEDVDLSMPTEARFNARFEGEDGQDLSGVTVLLWNDSYTVGQGAQADAAGDFTVDQLHGGDYRLFVYAEPEGYLNDFVRGADQEPVLYHVDPSEDAARVEVSLPRAAWVEAQLVDETGAPVYGGSLYLLPEDDNLDTVAGTSDIEGYVSADGIAPGLYRMELRYSAYCEQDPGYVTTWWPGVVDSRLSEAISFEAGEVFDAGVIVLAQDSDNDGMGDAWEREHGLDVGRDDSGEDPDGDGYTNLEEYLLGTDPTIDVREAEDCGCDGEGEAWLLGPLSLLALGRRRRRRT
ncbi:MAG: carboxypeptidase regulatory-like domain-containing protein [Alphaproteobacteria bacterium]|nr:carboxypeptidase regulatory-like domain-containing protein [Alphaproteobacteria bacterium]